MTELLKQEERAVFDLRRLYQAYGYTRFRMSKFEEYDLYMRNKDFLVSDGVITFTDTDGTLLALKPDVTLSIVKNYRREPGAVQKVYYTENVYRVAGASCGFREIMQTGLECLGDVGPCELCEVVLLAVQSLAAVSDDYLLDLSHMDLVTELLEALPLGPEEKSEALRCVAQKNVDGLGALCGPSPTLEQLLALMEISGPLDEALERLDAFAGTKPYRELEAIAGALKQAGLAKRVHLDFSIVSDRDYYNGVVFRGYLRELPSSVLSGGQYNKLMRKMGKDAGGVGFAVYLDQLERLDTDRPPYDVDAVLLHDGMQSPASLLAEAQDLRQTYGTVLTARQMPVNLKARVVLRYENGRLEQLENNG